MTGPSATTPRNERGYNEVVIYFGGRVDGQYHAYDGNPEGRTACGLWPDKLGGRAAWKIVPFERCPKCDEAVSR